MNPPRLHDGAMTSIGKDYASAWNQNFQKGQKRRNVIPVESARRSVFDEDRRCLGNAQSRSVGTHRTKCIVNIGYRDEEARKMKLVGLQACRESGVSGLISTHVMLVGYYGQ